MGFSKFGPGKGLQRFVRDNNEFSRIPRIDTLANTLYAVTGIEAGQSMKLVGTFVVPPGLVKDLYFVMLMARDRTEEKPLS